MDKEHRKAVLFLILTALLWSTGGMLIKLVSWNSVAIAGARSAIAALMLWAVMKRPKLKLSFSFIGGVLMYAATVILFVSSTKLTTAASAILLQYTAPIYVAIFGYWILKERATLIDWVTIVVVLGGMVLFFVDDLSGGGLVGNVLGVLSGITFAFMIMFMRKEKNDDPLAVVFWGNVLTALVCIPFMAESVPDTRSILGLILLGVFQLGLAYIFYARAIRHINALEAVLIQIIEPLLNPLWVLLFVGERPSLRSLIGGAIVLATILGRGLLNAIKEKDNGGRPRPGSMPEKPLKSQG